eukprot:55635-Eustigmatos_ZCMA.PRE.1
MQAPTTSPTVAPTQVTYCMSKFDAHSHQRRKSKTELVLDAILLIAVLHFYAQAPTMHPTDAPTL